MKNKQLLWLIGGVGVVALIAFFAFGNETQTVDSQATSGTPSFQVNTQLVELGEIAVDGDYPAEFTISNTGDAPLEISDVRTSCMCTYAEITIDGEKSPEFNMVMHNSPALRSWKETLAPGQTATVKAIYKPYLMPVQGPVDRYVIFNTNDPNNPEVQLGVKAIVQ